MAKDFTKNKPLEKLAGKIQELTEKPVQETGVEHTSNEKSTVTTVINASKKTTEKKPVGRPKIKTEETKTINIAIPISTLDKMEIAKECYSKNLTMYINTLIEKDLNENYEKYLQISSQLKTLNIF